MPGLSDAEVEAIIQEARENDARLRACSGPHDFEEHERRGTVLGSYRCRRCGGVVDVSQGVWYRLGLAHARHPVAEELLLAMDRRGPLPEVTAHLFMRPAHGTGRACSVQVPRLVAGELVAAACGLPPEAHVQWCKPASLGRAPCSVRRITKLRNL